MKSMKTIGELELGFPDAENYRRREFKEKLNRVFFRDEHLDKILSPQISFLIGDKGTGKTAYGVYLNNNHYNNCFSSLKFIRETEYQKFVSLKKEKHLDLSDYTNIWKVIILLLLSRQIIDKEHGLLAKYFKLRSLNRASDEYYLHAFSPEIIYALQFVQESKHVAELLSKHAKVGGEEPENLSFSESRFQTNLLYIQRSFESAISDLKLENNFSLFIDGIDIRPSSIDFPEYLDCIKGLANAVWHLNNDFFPSIKDSRGRMKTVLLVRPDIFVSLGLQNQNTKLRSNSVLLDWRTSYSNFKHSMLFKICDKLLSSQQTKEIRDELKPGDAWDHYFPYKTPTSKQGVSDSSFIGFLRYSLYRPRDLIIMIDFLRENIVEEQISSKEQFEWRDFDSSKFRKKLSDYLLGEIKDQLLFYYSEKDYEAFIKFFAFLDGNTRFDYTSYLVAFSDLTDYLESINQRPPRFMDTANGFLQFLYDLNVICYIEEAIDHKPFIHWCFRDRSYSNIRPKIKTNVRYEIFYGLGRAVNAGKKLKRKSLQQATTSDPLPAGACA